MFIEGIGPNWGFTPYGLLACKYDDSVQVYSFENEHIKDCSFKNMSVDNYIHEDNVKIYPNPVAEILTIETSDITDIIITDIAGRMIAEKRNCVDKTCFDTSRWKMGIYFVNLYSRGAKIRTEKTVKN